MVGVEQDDDDSAPAKKYREQLSSEKRTWRRNGKGGKNGRDLADRSFARGVRARRRCRRRCRQQGGFVVTAARTMQHEDGDIEVLSMAAEREQRD